MGYLISEILLYLILAALIGGVIGWILKSFFCGNCEEEISQWRTKYTALEGRYASLEASAGANASASGDDASLRAKISGLEETNGLQADRIADLEGRLTDGSAASEGDAELAAENARLKSELSDSNKKLAAASAASAAAGAVAAKAASSDNSDLTAENKRLKADLSASKKASKKLEADLAACAKRTAQLEADAAKAASAAAAAKAAPAAKAPAKTSTKKEAYTTDAPAPKGLLKKADGKKDDLKEIWGVGPVMEGVMNKLGLFHFRQVAELSDRDVEWVSANIGTFPDRIKRDKWVSQAADLHKKHHG